MSRKLIPFDERPTWQRVKDLQEAAFMLRTVVDNALSMREHWDKPAMQDAMERQMRDAVARLNAATGRTEIATRDSENVVGGGSRETPAP